MLTPWQKTWSGKLVGAEGGVMFLQTPGVNSGSAADNLPINAMNTVMMNRFFMEQLVN